jgi:hypothetical protein
MEVTTALVLRSRNVGISKSSTTAARRNPTAADWQRWKPAIAARYKNATVRMMVLEMEAEQLHVT